MLKKTKNKKLNRTIYKKINNSWHKREIYIKEINKEKQ